MSGCRDVLGINLTLVLMVVLVEVHIVSGLSESVAFIVLSCLIAVAVNFSTFMVIGKTSPVTYQVLGHLKTCLVLAFGYLLLRDPFSWRNIFGILVALGGMVLYSYYITIESRDKSTDTPALPQTKQGESDPLINVENGSPASNDVALTNAHTTQMWKSDRNLHA